MTNPIATVEQAAGFAKLAVEFLNIATSIQSVDALKDGHPTLTEIEADLKTAEAALADAISKGNALFKAVQPQTGA